MKTFYESNMSALDIIGPAKINLYRCGTCGKDYFSLAECVSHMKSHNAVNTFLDRPISSNHGGDALNAFSHPVNNSNAGSLQSILPSTEKTILQQTSLDENISPVAAQNDFFQITSTPHPSNQKSKKNANTRRRKVQIKNQVDTNAPEVKWLPCKHCFAAFMSEIDLQKHLQKDHIESDDLKDNSNAADGGSADIETQTPSSLPDTENNASQSEGSNESSTTAEKRQHSCPDCPARFSHLSSLSLHKRKHSGHEPYVCDDCGKRFWDPSNLRVHVRIHTNERPFKCDICGFGFNQANDLKTHRRKHTGEAPFHCTEDECNASFRDASHYRRHMKKHAGIKPHIKCDQCDLMFFHQSGLLRHRRKHTGEKDYVCSVCKAAFARADTLKLHKRTHTGEKPYQCGECGKRFADRSQCRRHLKKKHENSRAGIITRDLKIKQEPIDSAPSPSIPSISIKKPDLTVEKKFHVPTSGSGESNGDASVEMSCESIEIELPDPNLTEGVDTEEIVYQYGDMLITISRSSTTPDDGERKPDKDTKTVKWLACTECGAVFSTDQELQAHSGRHHEENSGKLNKSSSPMQSQCESDSPHPSSSDDKMAGSVDCKMKRKPRTGDKKWECTECSMSFFHLAELKRHQTKHTGEMPYQCRICGKRTRDPSNLKRHIRTHTGERPYKCSFCMKAFSQAGHLSSHLRTHTGERPYQCNQCNAKFVESNHLRHHLKVHAGIKPYKCVQCDLAFIRPAELKRHLRIHSGVRPFKCTICTAMFLRQDALKTHLKKHNDQSQQSDVLKFQCETCPKVFSDANSFQKHLYRHQRNNSFMSSNMQTSAAVSVSNAGQNILYKPIAENTAVSVSNTEQSISYKPVAENTVAADALCELAAGRRNSVPSEITELLTLESVGSHLSQSMDYCQQTASSASGEGFVVEKSIENSLLMDRRLENVLVNHFSGSDATNQQIQSKLNIGTDTVSLAGDSDITHYVEQIDDGETYILSADGAYLIPKRLCNSGDNSAPFIIVDSSGEPCNSDFVLLNASEQPNSNSNAQSISLPSTEVSSVAETSVISDSLPVTSISAIHSSIDHQYFLTVKDSHSTQTVGSHNVIIEENPSELSLKDQESLSVEQIGMEEANALETTMKSILSGEARLESVAPLGIRLSGDSNPAGKEDGTIVVKQEITDTDMPNEHLVPGPLRTRSGRERKIKIKFSL